MSSDKLAAVNAALLSLDLDLKDGAGATRHVTVEMDHHELKQLLSSLEACSKVIFP